MSTTYRTAQTQLAEKIDCQSVWLQSLIEFWGIKRTPVTRMAKNARAIWAVLVKGQT